MAIAGILAAGQTGFLTSCSLTWKPSFLYSLVYVCFLLDSASLSKATFLNSPISWRIFCKQKWILRQPLNTPIQPTEDKEMLKSRQHIYTVFTGSSCLGIYYQDCSYQRPPTIFFYGGLSCESNSIGVQALVVLAGKPGSSSHFTTFYTFWLDPTWWHGFRTSHAIISGQVKRCNKPSETAWGARFSGYGGPITGLKILGWSFFQGGPKVEYHCAWYR